MKTKEQRRTNVRIKCEKDQKQMMKRSCCLLWVHLDTHRPSPQMNYTIADTARVLVCFDKRLAHKYHAQRKGV